MAAPNFSAVDDTLGLYNYTPNKPAAILGTLGYIAIATVHLWQSWQHWPWHFWATSAGIAGLGARVVSIYQPTNTSAFFTSYSALLLAPSLTAIACYVTFGQIMLWVTPPEGRQTIAFRLLPSFVARACAILAVTASMFTLIGAGITAATYLKQSLSEALPQAGFGMLTAGLVLQLTGLLAFSGGASWTMLFSRCWMCRSSSPAARLEARWRQLGWATIAATVLLVVLSIYRIAELYSSVGNSVGYVALYEWPFWVFDTIPMLGVCVLTAALYLSRVPPPKSLGVLMDKQKQYEVSEDADFATRQ